VAPYFFAFSFSQSLVLFRLEGPCHPLRVMSIVIAFHGSGFRNFKAFYTLQVLPHWKSAFPNLVSYNRFVELMPWSLMGLLYFLNTCVGEMTGISFVDSTCLEVCHPKRAHSHKVFKGLADWGKSSVGWYFGFKLHLIVNDRGQILAFALTEGNVDDRKRAHAADVGGCTKEKGMREFSNP
jgi:hypothetical protein